MALGIIKPGQGYWMRVMTACLIGIATLTTAGWVAKQMGVIVDKLPKSSYVVSLSEIQGPAPAPGSQVSLVGRVDSTRPEQVIGTATIGTFSAEDRAARLDSVRMQEKFDIALVRKLVAGDAAAPTSSAAATKPAALPPVEPLYVQGGVAGLIIIVGAVLAYWLAGTRHSTVDFLVATDYEMKKVNWSTPKELMGSTTVVIIGFFFIAAVLFIFDFLLQLFFTQIDVIQKATA
ncbi:MAG: preprotein translocase subunit SecE [Phycisphaeraceae bacterium]|nr:preprotein translocase subunit SecE [Phycisphaeraceae bacterium]